MLPTIYCKASALSCSNDDAIDSAKSCTHSSTQRHVLKADLVIGQVHGAQNARTPSCCQRQGILLVAMANVSGSTHINNNQTNI
jgi:hypothetical protein